VYSLGLCILFAILATYPPHRKVWAVVSCVCAAEFVAWGMFDRNDVELYVIQSTAALLGGLALIRQDAWLPRYQAAIYVGTLAAYLALAIDVAAGKHILIYNHFEAVIYGLVAGQLVGIFPTVRAGLVLCGPISAFSVGSLQRSQKR
jgi:hypothetical protein